MQVFSRLIHIIYYLLQYNHQAYENALIFKAKKANRIIRVLYVCSVINNTNENIKYNDNKNYLYTG